MDLEQIKEMIGNVDLVTLVVAVLVMLGFNVGVKKLKKPAWTEDLSQVVKEAYEAGRDGKITFDEAMEVAAAGVDTVAALRGKKKEIVK